MRNFRNFAYLPNSPNLEYFEKFGNFPFPPCVLSFLKVHCHPNFPIIPSATCTHNLRKLLSLFSAASNGTNNPPSDKASSRDAD